MTLAQRIHGASPFGPIFGKELRIASRRKRNHLLRVFYLGGLLLFLLMVYVSTAPTRYAYAPGNVASRMQQQAELGEGFFITFSLFCVGCMGLISPILTSTAISSERLGNTLTVLLMTPITSWQIVAGKLFSRLLIALMLIGLSLPVLAVVRLLGAVELWQMMAVIAVSTAFALSCAALGLFYSCLLNRAYAVILLSYATMFLVYFLAPMLLTVVLESRMSGLPPVWYLRLLPACNPPINVGMICIPDVGTTVFRSATLWAWLPCVLVQLGLTLALLTASSWIVRRHGRREGTPAALPAAPLPAPPPLPAATALDEPDPATPAQTPVPSEPTEPRVGESRRVGNNPVLWRELRRPLISGRFARLAGILVVLVLVISYACFASIRVLDERGLQVGYAFIFHGLFWLLTAVLSATAIAQEKESDTWTLLLTAPLSAQRIVMGKLWGIARRMIWPLVLIAAHFTLFTITSVITPGQCLLILWVLLTFNCVWAASGLYLSLRMKKVTTAVITNLMIVVVLYAGVPLVLSIIGELLSSNSKLVEFSGLYIPFVYLVQIGDYEWYLDRDSTIWSPVFGQIHWGAFAALTAIAGLLHLSAAAGIVRLTIRRFNPMVGRAEQSIPLFR
jgi:ABC-type transport system involved in multi-copper enzyme maturation permease subunit